MLLRSMSPQIIAMDELGAAEGEAVLRAADSGVSVWASLHCASPEELARKPFPRQVFRRGVLIRREGGKRIYREVDIPW